MLLLSSTHIQLLWLVSFLAVLNENKAVFPVIIRTSKRVGRLVGVYTADNYYVPPIV